MKRLEKIRIRRGGHKLDSICIVLGLMMMDAVVYLLLELLLVDYDTYHGQSGGSSLAANPTFYERFVYFGRYLWFGVNFCAVLLIALRAAAESKGSSY
ncbi:MAG: hypothetical protein AB3N14_05495 [Flavobacteriaceae bacterium]